MTKQSSPANDTKSKSKSKSKSVSNTTSNENKIVELPEKINVKINKKVINNSGESAVSTSEGTSRSVKNKKKNSIICLVVEKNGDLRETEIKLDDVCKEELSKKCRFKKVDGFEKRTEWSYSSKHNDNDDDNDSSKIIIAMWGKDDGMANHENKYEFPPPVDHELYFGACILIAHDSKNNYVDLTEDKWNKIYEYLFGGFESLAGNEDDDEDEEDELDSISAKKKTRDGYLKDGFVVDSIGNICDGESEDDAGNDSDINSDDETNDDSDVSEEDSEVGKIDNDEDGKIYKKKKKNEIIKKKLSGKVINNGVNKHSKEDDEENSGWNTDESSELSEEEYSYS
jgi:hypothetical protein